MIKKFLYLYISLFSLVCISQEFGIKGNLKDINNQPIVYANTTLINTENSLPIAGTTTNESGDFVIDKIKTGNYLLKISFLGFKTFTKQVRLDRNINFNTIILEENLHELKGVTIVAKKPTIERMVDRLVFNVENSTLSNNNVLDVLKHTPGVLLHNNAITIKQSIPTVYINDRRIHLSPNEVQQLLENTPANNIKSIEVMTNPPAKYEAEGGSVLNIITSKNIIAGYNGSVFGNYKQGSKFPKYSFGTSHFFKTKKLNTYLSYNINPKKEYRDNEEFVNFINDGKIRSSWETDYKKIRKSSNQNINANIDYELNDSNILGFSTSMLIIPRNNTKTGINSSTKAYSVNKTLDSIFNTVNKSVNETFNLAFTLDYIHKFKNKGEKLSASLHHTNYDFSNFQDVKTGYFLPNIDTTFRNNEFQTFSSQEIKLYTGQADYELPINKSSQFEAGLKISNIKSKSILNQFIFENDIKLEDLDNSDVFLYHETNYAAYLSYSKNWNKWSLKSGLRFELTNIKSNSLSTSQINNNDYLKVFPSIHVLNRINENNEIYFSYNKRIHRPRYSQLNPYKFFLNDYTYTIGDPNLKPQVDDVFTLGYTFNEIYTFEFYYRYEKDPAIQVAFQDNNNNLLKYISTNINKSFSYGLDFSTNARITNRWNLNILSSVFNYDNHFIALESNNTLEKNSKWSLYTQITNNINFLKNKSLIMDISYLYISPYAEGPTIVGTRSQLDISLLKTLWKSRASISIGVTDVFNINKLTNTNKYLNQDVFFKSKEETRLLVFGFNYKFGNSKLKNNKKEIDSNERDRLSD
ncbi:hypothetical protein A8C32_03240 [Flavivirga aquatica]|uniref:Outer membrane protein beta-barrel domain-containing protein n=1 Tax=Flavivirga aquatica TaxID=1849968 RepID=A0A1E5TAT5_9FLAO|nr:TonB-dependent receptor [Flavivirga aquatica]OEK08479.1 hypothetical protein A8C32_03240 [Flavivirga aquatica]